MEEYLMFGPEPGGVMQTLSIFIKLTQILSYLLKPSETLPNFLELSQIPQNLLATLQNLAKTLRKLTSASCGLYVTGAWNRLSTGCSGRKFGGLMNP